MKTVCDRFTDTSATVPHCAEFLIFFSLLFVLKRHETMWRKMSSNLDCIGTLHGLIGQREDADNFTKFALSVIDTNLLTKKPIVLLYQE